MATAVGDPRDFRLDDVLKDGTRVTIRAVRRDDRSRFVEAFGLLEKDSIYTRFFSYRKPTDAEVDRAINVDFVQEVALVVTTEASHAPEAARREPQGHEAITAIIASGRYIRIDRPGAERAAEVAFIVEEDYQGRGIASRLIGCLATIARSQGVTQFEAEVLSENGAMLSVFRRCGFPARQRREAGVIHVEIALTPDAVKPPGSESVSA